MSCRFSSSLTSSKPHSGGRFLWLWLIVISGTTSGIQVLHLPKEVGQTFSHFARHLQVDPQTHVSCLTPILGDYFRQILPNTIQTALQHLAHLQEEAIVLIKGMPVDEVRPGTQQKSGYVSEYALLGLAGVMKLSLQSNPKEQQGRLFHHIKPMKGFEQSTSSKSTDPFYLHIENPFQATPPDFLALICLEGDPGAETTYFPLASFLQQLPLWVTEGMSQPDFEIRSGAGLDEEEKGRFPLLACEQSLCRVRLYQSMARIRALKPAAQEVLDYLTGAFDKIKNIPGVALEKGDVLIFNNGLGMNQFHGVMHGRRGIITNPHRWLQRAFLVKA